MSRPSGSTPRPGPRSGSTSTSCTAARRSPCSSPPTTWTRPSTATASPSSTRADRRPGHPGRPQVGHRQGPGPDHHPTTTPGPSPSCADRFELEAAVHEGAVTFAVAEGAAFVPRLFAGLDVPIDSVTVTRPSLDDVFLAYTGTTIRDAEAARPMQPDGLRGPGEVSPDDRRSNPPAPRWRPSACPPPACATRSAAAAVVWQREMIRFGRDRSRIISSLIQPVLFLFVLGTGLSSLIALRRRPRLPDLPVPGRAGHVGAVHCRVLGHLDGLGPGVRLPAGDDGRPRQHHAILTGKCPGRGHRGHPPEPDHPRPGPARRRALRPGDDGRAGRAGVPDGLHDLRPRAGPGRPGQAGPVGHAAGPAHHHPADVPLRVAVPPVQPARLAARWPPPSTR